MSTEAAVMEVLATVLDPEVPAISLVDLGIIRGVSLSNDGVTITITPTYSGCPAMYEIERSIIAALNSNGFEQVKINTVLSPAWTTDWMSESGKSKLKAYGIAPPGSAKDALIQIGSSKTISCPFCDSNDTAVVSEFGATSCKALHRCNSCKQPFEYFKPH